MKRSVIISLLVLAAAGMGGAIAFQSKETPSDVVTVREGDIVQEVFVTGTVKPNRRVALSFERGGVIDAFPHEVGSRIAAGSLLASLKSATERANVAEAEATLGVAEAKLATVRRGSRQEEIRIKEATALERSVTKQNLLEKTSNLIVDAYGAAETALHTTIDPLFEGDTSTAPRLSFPSGNQTAQYESESKRLSAETGLTALRGTTVFPEGSEETSLASAIASLRRVQDMLLALGGAIRDANGLSTATLEDYKDRVEEARGSVTTSITTLQNHQNAIREARSAHEKAVRELELARSGGSPEEIREAEQTVLQADAKLRAAKAALEKTVLRAPFSGYIASKSVEVGETVSTGEGVAEFQGADVFIVEANVPEADVTKLSVGTVAEITLDAYGDELVLSAKVTEVEPGETEVDGVPTYKTTLLLDAADPRYIEAFGEKKGRLRSGLTANITVRKVERTGVLILPARAVRSDSGELYVLRLRPDGEAEKIAVKTGSRSQTREIEITEGLSLNDRIMVPPVK